MESLRELLVKKYDFPKLSEGELLSSKNWGHYYTFQRAMIKLFCDEVSGWDYDQQVALLHEASVKAVSSEKKTGKLNPYKWDEDDVKTTPGSFMNGDPLWPIPYKENIERAYVCLGCADEFPKVLTSIAKGGCESVQNKWRLYAEDAFYYLGKYINRNPSEEEKEKELVLQMIPERTLLGHLEESLVSLPQATR